MTLMDYNVDHTHLRPHIRCALLMEMQYRILGEYMIAVDNRLIITFPFFNVCVLYAAVCSEFVGRHR